MTERRAFQKAVRKELEDRPGYEQALMDRLIVRLSTPDAHPADIVDKAAAIMGEREKQMVD